MAIWRNVQWCFYQMLHYLIVIRTIQKGYVSSRLFSYFYKKHRSEQQKDKSPSCLIKSIRVEMLNLATSRQTATEKNNPWFSWWEIDLRRKEICATGVFFLLLQSYIIHTIHRVQRSMHQNSVPQPWRVLRTITPIQLFDFYCESYLDYSQRS